MFVEILQVTIQILLLINANWDMFNLQVEEAVAVLQAHQAKEAASAQAK